MGGIARTEGITTRTLVVDDVVVVARRDAGPRQVGLKSKKPMVRVNGA